jgi:hypothetical protein
MSFMQSTDGRADVAQAGLSLRPIADLAIRARDAVIAESAALIGFVVIAAIAIGAVALRAVLFVPGW